jgi:plastocyanin
VQPPEGGALTPEGGVIEIEIAGARFVQNNLQMPLGESVTIRVTNSDQQAHNLRFAGLDGTYDTEDDAVVSPDPIPSDGGASELVYAPALAGTYTFRCDFHPGTMGGTMTVE